MRTLEGLFVIPKANASMANQCIKFEVSRLSRPKDILWELKIQNGSRDVAMPISFRTVYRRRMGLAMINLRIKFEVSMFTQ